MGRRRLDRHGLDRRREELLAGLRAQGITSETVLAAMAEVFRPAFVPTDLQDEAWEDHPLPIGLGQTISQPFVVAYMTEELDLAPGDRVLDVGTGCGYQAAILAACGAEVTSIEVLPELAQMARENLARSGYGVEENRVEGSDGNGSGVEVLCGDGAQGVPSAAPFDGILVAAATGEVPPALLRQLREPDPASGQRGGRLILPLRDGGSWLGSGGQRLTLIERTPEGFRRDELRPVRFVPLVEG